jgi:hypothetical protein
MKKERNWEELQRAYISEASFLSSVLESPKVAIYPRGKSCFFGLAKNP